MQVAVVILNWNGKSFLEKFLPSVLAHSTGANIYVADNASSDGSVAFLRSTFPSVRIIETGGNLGYAGGYNAALAKLEEDIFVLLNSDVEVTENWLEPIIEMMTTNENVAACQPKLLQFDNPKHFEYAGAAGGFIDRYGFPFCRGRIFETLETDHGQYDEPKEVFWASGACLFVRSSAFREIGGLDSDFFAHMEEIDLCWRLKRSGYRIMVQPRSVVYHVGGGTLPKSNPMKTYLNFRNGLELMIKNLPMRQLIARVFIRMIFDGIAAWKFLLTGSPKDFLAVVHAHFSVYGRLRSTWRKRGGNYGPVTEIYQRSIVFDHYLGRKDRFSELPNVF